MWCGYLWSTARRFLRISVCCSAALLLCSIGWSQSRAIRPLQPGPQAVQTPTKDPLGRTTPRGTVLGFLIAARKGDNALAAQYLNTKLNGPEAAELAAELFVVLDRGLPARLNELSDQPEGSQADMISANEYLVGIIHGTNEAVFLERVDDDKSGQIWLFASETLKRIPDIYEETNRLPVEAALPEWLVERRIANIPLYELIAIMLGWPLVYLLTGLLGRLLSPVVGVLLRRISGNTRPNPKLLSRPVRLLILAAVIQWVLSTVELSLLARQFWSSAAAIIATGACIWILILLNSRAEAYIRDHLQSRNLYGATSVQRLIRRTFDFLFVVAGVLFMLRHFGVDPTAALAGLGVGGIAIALAAQKTLENVIGGVSLIIDKAVRVGDFMKVGDAEGTVEDIGLRSIRIRTMDRTMLVIPNGQLANMNLEVLSSRDKFWFHPMISIRHETNSDAIRSVVNSIHTFLTSHDRVERESVRVRLYRIGAFSLDVDVFAYVLTRQWHEFLEIQGQLLHRIIEIMRQSGVAFAFPSQTMYLAPDSASETQIVVRSPVVESEADKLAQQENTEKSARPKALGRAV